MDHLVEFSTRYSRIC